MLQICSKCREVKELSEYYKNKNMSLGRNYYCKSCHKAYCQARAKKYQEQNKDWRTTKIKMI